MVGHTALRAKQSCLIPPLSLHGGEGSSFPDSIPPNDTVESKSVEGVIPSNLGAIIRYQVDKFTGTWFAEHFIAQSHILPGFRGKVSTLTHFPLEPGCENYFRPGSRGL